METSHQLESVPMRVFLDTCLLRVIVKYGEYIWDGGLPPTDPKFYERENALRDLDDLRFLCLIAQRAGLPWLITKQSMDEILRSRRHEDAIYAIEFFEWTQENFPFPKEATPGAIIRAHRLYQKSLAGRLGKGDQALLRDAIIYGCDAFLTWELKLPKLSDSIFQQTRLRVCTPQVYVRMFQPIAAVYW